jgi:hypothetical protein
MEALGVDELMAGSLPLVEKEEARIRLLPELPGL